ncbi:cytochrome b [Azospirillum sp. sgz301742]
MGHRYTAPAMALHWLMALLVLVMFATGLTVKGVAEGSALIEPLRTVHRPLGITIMALAVVRILYRMVVPPPPLPAEMPLWQREIARWMEWTFLFTLLAMPLIGWGYTNALGKIVDMWGFFTLPVIAGTEKETLLVLDLAHEYIAKVFQCLIGLHVAAALFHHYVRRDGVMAAMLPGRRSTAPAAVTPQTEGGVGA